MGATSALVGVALMAAGIARPAFASGSFLATPAWAFLLTAGGVLGVAGAVILVLATRVQPEEPDIVPAHVAFQSRMSVQPLTPMPTPAGGRMVSEERARPRLQAPAAPIQRRVGPSREDIDGMSAQIQELTKKINKAGVMLATGQLSQEGYLAYVDDLKRQRGNLEAAKVRAEMRS
ncbi:MAG TPA: hypothetical protein VFH78_10295 [Candidatus Thermoplasmatota archaeon]|nr:hypothetical protein [Candidatus Thermoplasmatota archaeon]